MAYKVMGTGSRKMVIQPDRQEIYDKLEAEIFKLREEHKDLVLVSGMAEGWDEAIALVGLRNNIPYEVHIPNKGYGDYYWSAQHSLLKQNRMGRFNQLVNGAAKKIIVCNSIYVNGVHANFIRNQSMIDASDLALVYHAPGQADGGTGDAVRRMSGVIPFKVYPFN